MAELQVQAFSRVTQAELQPEGRGIAAPLTATFGPRFGRLDRSCQLGLIAVERLGEAWRGTAPERVGLCVATRVGSLPTDLEFWRGREGAGGPSPMLFAYTLPSAVLGEIAIRHRLTGPNLCVVGKDTAVLSEAADWLRRGEAEGVICLSVEAVTPAAAALLGREQAGEACALYVVRGGASPDATKRSALAVLGKNDRDMTSLCARLAAPK